MVVLSTPDVGTLGPSRAPKYEVRREKGVEVWQDGTASDGCRRNLSLEKLIGAGARLSRAHAPSVLSRIRSFG